MNVIYTVECPKCKHSSELTQSEYVDEPLVSCGNCLMEHAEVVAMKIVKVERERAP